MCSRDTSNGVYCCSNEIAVLLAVQIMAGLRQLESPVCSYEPLTLKKILSEKFVTKKVYEIIKL